jgi:hypothetical protein
MAFSRSTTWDLISVVRDPIARAVSAYFYARRLSPTHTQVTSSDITMHVPAIETMIRKLAFERDWFIEELRIATAIDVYEERFPTDTGWAVYCNDRFRTLVLRTEDLQRTAPAATARFFGLQEPIALPVLNSGIGRDSEYERFLRDGRFASRLVTAVYETRMMQHFYDDRERDEFRRRWSE